jgi:hypothetical protein
MGKEDALPLIKMKEYKIHRETTSILNSEFFPSSGMLHRVGWFRTSVSRRPISPIFKDQDVQDSLTLEYGTDK